jgi:hypothetical protein
LNRGTQPMLKVFKRVFDAYVAGAGNYPVPMVWTF